MGKLERSEKERGRLRIGRESAAGKMTIRKGAAVLGVSYRLLLRVVWRFKESGAEGREQAILKNRASRGCTGKES